MPRSKSKYTITHYANYLYANLSDYTTNRKKMKVKIFLLFFFAIYVFIQVYVFIIDWLQSFLWFFFLIFKCFFFFNVRL